MLRLSSLQRDHALAAFLISGGVFTLLSVLLMNWLYAPLEIWVGQHIAPYLALFSLALLFVLFCILYEKLPFRPIFWIGLTGWLILLLYLRLMG
jgi:endonuclease/exonuclease/phosphatase (EEP) superfamily protein YafD